MPTENLVPWKIVAASPDMMDITYNNRRFPFAWRSSLAISVYEPSTAELPARLCGQKIAFVKVTCSLTGYQPMGSDSREVSFGDIPLEELERFASEYLGCYGALLNVAFFPPSSGITVVGEQPNLYQFPHILDFSPKSRELIRSITENGEMLTGSSRSVGVDQSMTTTNKNETTVGLEAGYEAGGLKATGKIEHKWGTTQEDKNGLSIDSGDRFESTTSYSTTLDQLYSLLTGYHSGTNRATFIMLARPGTLQATDRRTFAPGLRVLEGVQDFLFVVARPEDQDQMCIEAALHTGHFPEDVRYVPEGTGDETRQFTFTVNATAKGGSEGFFSFSGETIEFGTADRPQDVFNLPEDENGPWLLDIDAPGTKNGIALGEDRTRTDPPSIDGILYNHFSLDAVRLDDRTVRAIGSVTARGGYDFHSGPTTYVDVDFIIHARRSKVGTVQPTASTEQLLITKRSLSVCYRSVEGCPEVYEPLPIPDIEPEGLRFVDDYVVNPITSTRSTQQLYATIRSALINGAAAIEQDKPTRTFAETNYFSQRLANRLPSSLAASSVGQILYLQNYGANVEKRLANANVKQLLALDLRSLQRATGLNDEDALKIRRDLLVALEKSLRREQQ